MVNAVHYKPEPDRLDEMAEHQAVKKRNEETLKKNWLEDVQAPAQLTEYRPVFLDMLTEVQIMWAVHLGRIKVGRHRIDLLNDEEKQIHYALYRARPTAGQLAAAELIGMFAEKIIRLAITEWATPIVFAPKEDSSLRFCVDHCKLNTVTIRDSHHLRHMDECIYSLGEATAFSILGANFGHWQIEFDPGDWDKTALTFHHGLYRSTRMPFGLENAPETFQRAVDNLLFSVRWQFTIVDMRDIVIFSKSPGNHIGHVRHI